MLRRREYYGYQKVPSKCSHDEVFWASWKPNEWATHGFEVCGECGMKWPPCLQKARGVRA